MATELNTWITGDAGTGKTTHLVQAFSNWLETAMPSSEAFPSQPSAIVFAANHSTRRQLTQHLMSAIGGKFPFVVKTPLGFMEDEVKLFSPLWYKTLGLTPHFPLQLRSETEQDLAMKLWHDAWLDHTIVNPRLESRLVRTTLDILQLAGASGTPLEEIPPLLMSKLSAEEKAAVGGETDETIFAVIGELILQWRDWCLERGLLTYGLIYYLYGQVLLPDRAYQEQLQTRYHAIFADDVDDYPAIAQDLASLFVHSPHRAVFTFNPNGKVRFGLGADPDIWEKLAAACEEISLSASPSNEHPPDLAPLILEMVSDPSSLSPLPPSIQHLQTISRAQMLRQTATAVIKAINAQKVAPEDIAIIAPGLDEIARYTLIKLFSQQSIPVSPLNEQRPLMTSSLVRALLTLTCLVYPELGRLIDNSAIAEMLVVLTEHTAHSIDPVRAGLIADYCYQADPRSPRLLDIKTYPRWDRIGYQAQTAYSQLLQWIEDKKTQQQLGKPMDLLSFFNQVIQQFLWKGDNLPVADLSSLRELTETAQHYWEVQRRLQTETGNQNVFLSDQIREFIQLLKQGTITANPYPLPAFGQSVASGITLSNIFQYRSQRISHRWQFWLDVGSPLWSKQGAANLFASSAFIRGNTPDFEEETHLKRLLKDLLNRATEKVYLCHSDLAVNGAEQTGLLLSLVQVTTPIQC